MGSLVKPERAERNKVKIPIPSKTCFILITVMLILQNPQWYNIFSIHLVKVQVITLSHEILIVRKHCHQSIGVYGIMDNRMVLIHKIPGRTHFLYLTYSIVVISRELLSHTTCCSWFLTMLKYVEGLGTGCVLCWSCLSVYWWQVDWLLGSTCCWDSPWSWYTGFGIVG